MSPHKVVSKGEWLAARKALLEEEKEFTRLRDRLSEKRRSLPWTKVEKQYVFAGADDEVSLAELFGSCNQLLVYHFMFDPEWLEGCKSCSMLADHYDPLVVHLRHRDVSLATVSRAPLEKLQEFQTRMGWSFPWVSSFESDFNHDFRVSFSPEEIASGAVDYNYCQQTFPLAEAPGLSAFYKNDQGDIFHTYSTYARGLGNVARRLQLSRHGSQGS